MVLKSICTSPPEQVAPSKIQIWDNTLTYFQVSALLLVFKIFKQQQLKYTMTRCSYTLEIGTPVQQISVSFYSWYREDKQRKTADSSTPNTVFSFQTPKVSENSPEITSTKVTNQFHCTTSDSPDKLLHKQSAQAHCSVLEPPIQTNALPS